MIKDGGFATPGHAHQIFDQQWMAPVCAAIIASIVFAFPMVPYLAEANDMWQHIEYAKTIHRISDLRSPHFLFELLIIAGNRLTGISYDTVTIALMSICYALMAALIASRMKKVNPLASSWFVVLVAVLVLVASHVFLQTVFKMNFYNGYVVAVSYHNPTQVLNKAFGIAIMLAYFDTRDDSVWRKLLPVMVILSALAKPSFLIAFLPCVFAFEAYRYINGSRRVALRNLGLVVLPIFVILTIQFWKTYTGDGSGGGIGFAPFLVYGGANQVLWKFPGSLFFPVVAAAIIWRRQGVLSRELQFTWVLYFVGMFISICFVEAGVRRLQGNFGWTGQTVTFLLYVESAIALMALPLRRAWPAWSAFAVHVFFGIVWYSAALLMPLGSFL